MEVSYLASLHGCILFLSEHIPSPVSSVRNVTLLQPVGKYRYLWILVFVSAQLL